MANTDNSCVFHTSTLDDAHAATFRNPENAQRIDLSAHSFEVLRDICAKAWLTS